MHNLAAIEIKFPLIKSIHKYIYIYIYINTVCVCVCVCVFNVIIIIYANPLHCDSMSAKGVENVGGPSEVENYFSWS